MKMLKTLGLTLALAGLVTASNAAPIVGNIYFTSDANATLNAVPSLATQLNNWGTVTVSSGATGNYSGIAGGTAVTMGATPFVFGAVGTVGANVKAPLWTVAGGYSFDLLTISVNSLVGSARIIEGFGTAKITGMDNTPGFFSMSTSGTGTTVSFSAFTSVPDSGSTIALLGLALIGVAGLRRRMKS